MSSTADLDELFEGQRRTELDLAHRSLVRIPSQIASLEALRELSLADNRLTSVGSQLCELKRLRVLDLRNNRLDAHSLPKDLHRLQTLTNLNLAGNRLRHVPTAVYHLARLTTLQVGGNAIERLDADVALLQRLETLYIGGNRLKELPDSIGQLSALSCLALNDNQLELLPRSVSRLRRLHTLALHGNRLNTLPAELMRLKKLRCLSLRANPLVRHFARTITLDPPSLQELAARVIKLRGESVYRLPPRLRDYLSSAQRCVNPNCEGVFFRSCVQQVKFVDFCGAFQVPLMHYLCTLPCRTNSVEAEASSGGVSIEPSPSASSDEELDGAYVRPNAAAVSSDEGEASGEEARRLRRMLLG